MCQRVSEGTNDILFYNIITWQLLAIKNQIIDRNIT